MARRLRIAVGALAGVLIAVQAFRIDRTNPPVEQDVASPDGLGMGAECGEGTCEEADRMSHKGGLDKYNQQRDKLASLGICPSCLDGAAIDALGAATIAEVDSNNAVHPDHLERLLLQVVSF